MKRWTALVYLVTAALLWSTGGLFIKSVDWTPLGIAGVRSAIAAIALWGFARRFRFTWTKVQFAGAIAYCLVVVLFVLANKLTTAANAILLQYTAPIYVAIFAQRFLEEKVTGLDWFCIVFALFGMGLFFLDELTVSHFWGNIVAILSGVSFAWMTLLLRKQKSGSPLESIFLGNCLAALACLPFVLVELPPSKAWGGLVVMGVAQLALPYFFFSKAIKHVTAIEAIMIPFLEPILNPIWVIIFVGEKPGKMALIGGGIILTSVFIRALGPMMRMT